MSTNPSNNTLTLQQLRERRLRPARGQRPAARYWQGHRWIDTYAVAEAVPMQPYRVPSAAQLAALAAGRELVGSVACEGGCGARIKRTRKSTSDREPLCFACNQRIALAKDDCRFLDTETTGMGPQDQVIELCILDADGNPLIDTLVKPTVTISEGAQAVHGITAEELAHAPAWPDIAPIVWRLLDGRRVICHNANFDGRLLGQTYLAHGLAAPMPRYGCTVELLTEANGGRWPRSDKAMALALANADGREIDFNDSSKNTRHRAKFDAECCRTVVVGLVFGK